MADFADIVEEIKKTNSKLDKLAEVTDPSGAGATEDKRDEQSWKDSQLNLLQSIANALTDGSAGDEGLSAEDKKRGGLLAGIGGALGGLGIGAGVAMGGLGALFAGGGYLLQQLSEFDGKKVKENVLELVGIGDALVEKSGSIAAAFGKTGLLIAMLTGIGLALVAFSFGSVAASAAEGLDSALSMYTGKQTGMGTDWAQKIKDNIETLLSIQITSIAGVGELAGTMIALGAGLVAFAIGEVAAGVASAVTSAITMFTDSGGGPPGTEKKGWAEKIKDNVEMLLSINTASAIDTIGIVATMGALGAALVAFAIGEAAAGVATGLHNAIGMFTDTATAGGPPGTDQRGWAQKIKDNVETLLSIKTESALDTTGIVATMAALGGGLIAFSAGKAFGVAVEGFDSAISMFTGKKEGMGTGWAESIKKEVETLLSINTASVLDTAGIVFTLGALGLGLIVFSIGKLIGAGADAAVSAFTPSKEEIQAGHDKFSTGGWAQTILDEVTILLKIAELKFTDAAEFVATMSMIGVGLIVFGAGKIVGSAAEGLAGVTHSAEETKEGMDRFSEKGFAQKIKDEVTTLLSIASLPLGDAATFVAHMAILAGGLVAFSVGKGVAGFAEGINRLAGIGQEGDKSFADKIKDEVTTLLSIVNNPNATEEKVTKFKNVMDRLGSGLSGFAGENFVSALAGAGAAILNFFTGGTSPIKEMLNVAASADDLERGADALDKIAASLERVSKLNFKGDAIDIKDLAEDLLESVPYIEGAIMGGDVDPPGNFNKITGLKGLASDEIRWDDAARNIQILMSAFQIQGGSIQSGMLESNQQRQAGGPISAGKPYMVGEGGPELIIPSTAGKVLNAQRTAQMQQASLRNSMKTMGGGQSVLNNMPVSNISTNQSNTTVTATPLVHPSPIIGMVNAAA